MIVMFVNMRRSAVSGSVSASGGQGMIMMFMNMRRSAVSGSASATGGKRGKTASQPVAIPLGIRKRRRHNKPQEGNNGEKREDELLHFELFVAFLAQELMLQGCVLDEKGQWCVVKEWMRNKESATSSKRGEERKMESKNGMHEKSPRSY
jgi:hypothetical protein